MGTENASDTETPEGAGMAKAAPTVETAEHTPTAVDVSTIGDTLISEQPAVQEHAIEQAKAEAKASEGQDANGEAFNPAIHAQNADGTPRKTVGGAYAKKRGRKSGSATTASGSGPKVVIPGGASVSEPATLAKDQLARKGGAQAASLLLALCVGLGGDEWQPRKDDKIGLDERAMLQEVFGEYFVSTNRADLPPGWALTAGLAFYALPRFGMPKTQSRLARVKNWIGAKIVQWRARRAGLKVKVETASEAELVKDEMQHRDSFRKMHVPGMS